MGKVGESFRVQPDKRSKVRKKVIDEARTWPGEWCPQGRRPAGGGGLARVPNLRVCKHPDASRWHMQGGKDE